MTTIQIDIQEIKSNMKIDFDILLKNDSNKKEKEVAEKLRTVIIKFLDDLYAGFYRGTDYIRN